MSSLMDGEFKPIGSAAKDGRPFVVRRRFDYARARWHRLSGMWVYDIPGSTIEQIDFEPTHYAELTHR